MANLYKVITQLGGYIMEREKLVQLGLHKVSQLLEGGDLLIFHFQLNTQLGLQIHDHLYDIQRVNAQTFEGGIGSDIFLGDIHYEDLFPKQPAYYAESHQKLITGLRKFDFDKVLSGHQMLMTNVDLYAQLADCKTV